MPDPSPIWVSMRTTDGATAAATAVTGSTDAVGDGVLVDHRRRHRRLVGNGGLVVGCGDVGVDHLGSGHGVRW